MAHTKVAKREKKYFSKFRKPLTITPDLVVSQVESFDWLVKTGLEKQRDQG